MLKKNKVLIIKTGYSETLDKQVSHTSSLGDVLRTTVILPLFKDDHVTWLVDEHALPLLYQNPLIDRILLHNLNSVLQLQSERFDTIINFEKTPGLCALSDSISAWRRFGFRFDVMSGESQAYDNAEEAHSISQDFIKKRSHTKTWQQALYEMLGCTWNNEKYILGYKPTSTIKYNIGLNWAVGKTYPTKAWPQTCWQELSKTLSSRYTCSFQEGLENVYHYIDWIGSCESLITSDSLGLHIALALGKKVLIFYGPTHPGEVHLYGLGKAVFPKEQLSCMPCLQPTCTNDRFCMELITVDQVIEEVNLMMKN